MKGRILFCAIALVFSSNLLAHVVPPPVPGTGDPMQGKYLHAEAEYRAMLMRDENGQIPDNALMNAVQQKKQMPVIPGIWPEQPQSKSGSLSKIAGITPSGWTWLGPGNIGGRVRSILVHPTNSNIMWAGGVGGGVWKTLNGGISWAPLNDFLPNLAIGCMTMDPTDPNVIFAGTGEGFSNADGQQGAGILKTTDGGTTWNQIPSTANSSFYYVNRIAISPSNHLILLAATGSGIFRSTDGGTNWVSVYSTTAMLDVAFNPADGSKCTASGSTYYVGGVALYSINGGVTWASSSGISTSGRIEIAYAASGTNLVYASANNNSGEVYASTNGGQTYTLRNTGTGYLSSQGWYDNCIWVDPVNPNVVIVGGTDLYRSTDGGTSFTDIGGYAGGVHPDQHFIGSTPAYNGTTIRTLFIGNDGGIFKAADSYTVSPSSGWTTLNNNLGVTQFYGAAGNATSGTIVGGTQDNGTLRVLSSGNTSSWTSMFGGDGGYCAADQSNTNYFYGEYVYLQIHRSVNGGLSSSYITGGIGDAGLPDDSGGDPDGAGPDGDPDASANFIAPFILDPNNYNTMLAGGSNLWRSVNVKAGTPTWTNIKPGANGSFISAIGVAPGNSSIIWVGHNNGDVYSTTNGTNANPTWVRKDLGSPNLPNRTCTRLTIDPTNSSRVYATFGGFSPDNVYVTSNGGNTWSNIASALPAAPVHSLVVAPFNTNYLYVGSEVGVFASADGGAHWSPSNDGPSTAAVDELFWMGDTLVAATHGRGLFKILAQDRPVISLVSATLGAEDCLPTNGIIDPGEMVQVNFSLSNKGSVPTTNLTATLLATNGITYPGGPQNFGALAPGAAAVSRAFSFIASGTCGGSVTATLQLQDGPTNLGTVSAAFQMGTPNITLAEGFDSVTPPALPSGWTVNWTGAGAAWITTSVISDSAPNSAYAPDPTSPSDNQLISPVLMISNSTTQLSFRHNYSAETTYDGGVLEISIAGGAFTDILAAGGSFVTNGYNLTIDPTTDNVLDGRQVWSGSSGGFVTTIVNLPSSAVGQSVQFSWRFGSDTGNSDNNTAGWFVDTVTLMDGYSCCTGAPAIASLILSETPSASGVALGSNVTFTSVVTNSGPNDAAGVSITNSLPPQLQFVSAATSQGTWTNSGGVVSFSLGTVSNTSAASVSVTALALTNGFTTNTDYFSSLTAGLFGATNSAFAAVYVNARPSLTAIPNFTVYQGALLSFTAAATDADAPLQSLTYSLSNAPAGAVINPTNGFFSWTPSTSQGPGPFQLGVKATDSGIPPLSDTKVFTVSVVPPLHVSGVTITNQVLTLHWDAISNRTYRVQYKALITDSNWINLTPDIIAASASGAATNAVPLNSQRYYRLLLLP